ncbi:MAG: nucleoside deaminase [Deltaproteobacteria bacterium]|nr:nucleoside deaminase [Deltaproteobacteria bacterium]
MESDHEKYMEIAVEEAKKAGRMDEVPVGAVLVGETGEILSKDCNQTVRLSDPTAHAEILVLRQAAKTIHNYRLLNTSLYVTVEPCVMCMGAVIHARIARVIFGADDPKWGALGSIYNFVEDKRLNHHPEIIREIYQEECKRLMQDFFQNKR